MRWPIKERGKDKHKMKFIIQEFHAPKWVDVSRARTLDSARGDAWGRSAYFMDGSRANAGYGRLTRVIVRAEIVLCRYGQQKKVRTIDETKEIIK